LFRYTFAEAVEGISDSGDLCAPTLASMTPLQPGITILATAGWG
jgi:hypothetical protein